MQINRALLTLVVLQLSLYNINAIAACDPGFVYNEDQEKCVISFEAANTKVQANKCSGLTGDAYKQCFTDNAATKVSELEEDGLREHENSFDSGNGMKLAVPAAISLLTAYYLFLNKDKFANCKNTSMWLLFGGGVVTLVGEISAQMKFKSGSKKLEEDYKDRMKEYDADDKIGLATHNQKVAFDYLIAAQEVRIEAEKTRKGTYNLARIIFAAAGTMAIIESAQTGFKYGEGACGGGKLKKSAYDAQKHYDYLTLFTDEFDGYSYIENMDSTELLEIVLRKLYSNVIPTAYAYENDRIDNGDGTWTDPDDGKKYDSQYGGNVVGDIFSIGGGDNSGGDNGGGDNTKKITDALNKGKGQNVTGLFKSNYSDLLNSPMAKKQMNFLDKALATPYVRAALAGLLYIYADQLRLQAKKNIEIAKERIDAIKKLRDQFLATGGAGFLACTPEQRKDQSNPRCFCYTLEGKKDQLKSKLSACESVFKQSDLKLASNYNKVYGSSFSNPDVCINEKNQVDSLCKCKNSKSSTGKGNACLKVSAGMNFGGIGGGSWLRSLTSPADNLISGKLQGNELDTTKFNDMAIKMKSKLDSLGKDPKYSETYKKAVGLTNKMQKSHQGWFRKSFGNNIPRSLASSSLGGSSSSAAPKTLDDVVKQAQSQLKSSEAKFQKGNSLGSSGAEKKDDFNFDWGSEGDAKGGTEVTEFAKVMDKNYAIKGDINNNPSQSLFQILSMRYQRSGLRRLFDSEGKSAVDSANRTDINEK